MRTRNRATAAALSAAALVGGVGAAASANGDRAAPSTRPLASRAAENGFAGKPVVEVAPRRLAPQTPAGSVFVTFRLRHELPGGGAEPFAGTVRVSGLGASPILRADFSRPRTRCYAAATFHARLHGAIGRRVGVTFSGIPGMPATTVHVRTARLTSPTSAVKRLGCAAKHL